VMVEHPVLGMVCHALTAGEYWIAMSEAMVADTLYRRCPMSVRQAVDTFGARVNSIVRGMYDRSQYEEIVDIFHAIEPDPSWRPGDPFTRRWRSVYWDCKDDKDK